ncbi:DNA glycosylase [Mycena crocata]|nr:DNA glycosylase [Mycena crocata]
MPATRSATRSVSTSPLKRKPEATSESASAPKKAKPIPAAIGVSEPIPADAILTFSFGDAKRHLIKADPRFSDVFNRLDCKPFQKLEQFHPFCALASSILAQQISTLAARSIKHKFIRLYDPSIPEKHSDYSLTGRDSIAFFPTPQQVAQTDIATLRSAGLSGRKAEYTTFLVTDLATRFADGRLSTQKLLESNDEQLAEMLLEVRGIGRWTVDMFAIFSLRRPDILPVGDLGVQRGVLRWTLSQQSPDSSHSFSVISPGKEKVVSPKNKAKKAKSDEDLMPVFSEANEEIPKTPPPAEDQNSLIPLPPTFTPSIKRTLAAAPLETVPPLPEGLTVADLKSRLDGKKKIKGAFLSPAHMEQLTEHWRPYRSLGVYYMWALADAD